MKRIAYRDSGRRSSSGTRSGSRTPGRAAVLAAALAALASVALPAAAASAADAPPQKVIRAVMHADLKVLDPVWTTALITRDHALMVYDQLFAVDAAGRPRPEMVDRYEVSADGMRYDFVLRSGLAFHDGQPVRAADAVASIKRWAQRDPLGKGMAAAAEEIAATGDLGFTIRLKQPFGLVLDALAKQSGIPLVVMPERLARTDAATQVSDPIGSGPFIFKADEYQPGHKVVYVRNPNYAPRDEAPDGLAGGKMVKVDRVEWLSLTDPATAFAALTAGEIDFWEAPQLDFEASLAQNPDLALLPIDPVGMMGWVRPNHTQPPFDKVKVRQALVHIVRQVDYMRAIGAAPGNYRDLCVSFFMCGTPLETEAGAEAALHPSLETAKRLLAEAGYKGEKIVLLDPADYATLHEAALVAFDQLKSAGLNMELQSLDWGTLVTRRAKKEGWNLFLTQSSAIDATPANNSFLAASCENAAPGWPCDDELEKRRAAWMREPDAAKRKELAASIQERAYEVVPYVNWGQYVRRAAFRKDLTGLLQAGVPVFWNVDKR
ncbi:MAG TPA: ABC transporter substrate-binding protein [Stellaceae bacterium]|jgi:peptide/nickel transport system substrate-binding protein